ncbi:hypothetical protein Tco_1417549 [Tanacetum coccineum]
MCRGGQRGWRRGDDGDGCMVVVVMEMKVVAMMLWWYNDDDDDGGGAVVGVAVEWRGRVGCGGAGGEVSGKTEKLSGMSFHIELL